MPIVRTIAPLDSRHNTEIQFFGGIPAPRPEINRSPTLFALSFHVSTVIKVGRNATPTIWTPSPANCKFFFNSLKFPAQLSCIIGSSFDALKSDRFHFL